MPETPSFWSTVPGILTGIAGIILAVATLVTALHLGGAGTTPPVTPTPTITVTDTTTRIVVEKTYSVTIWSWDAEGWTSQPITMDGRNTGYSTPHTFDGLIGTHTFTAPATDPLGYRFTDWNTGETGRTLSVDAPGTYTAQYSVK